jgi:hypothetical protein
MSARQYDRFVKDRQMLDDSAERRSIGSVSDKALKSLLYLARNWKFESTPLQQTVRLSPDFASVPGKTRVFRHFGGGAGRQRRQRRAKPSNIAPRRGSVSVGRYSSTAAPPDAVCEIGGTGSK